MNSFGDLKDRLKWMDEYHLEERAERLKEISRLGAGGLEPRYSPHFIAQADTEKEEDIDVSIVGDTLTIKGESEVKEEDYYCCERSYGSFFRSIALPSNLDATKLEVSYEDGILEVSLPKAAEVKPKKISVSTKKKGKASK